LAAGNRRDGAKSSDLPRCEFEVKKLILRLDTVIDGHPQAVTPAVEGVMQVVRAMGCAEGKEDGVQVARQEALANAVLHGCKSDPNKKVECCVPCHESRGMLIVHRDPGEGFDPASIPSPMMGKNVFATHGRGIYIINQLMDEVRFERGGTQIHMLKR
jgi:serine/threonine-protein kinase RsbW